MCKPSADQVLTLHVSALRANGVFHACHRSNAVSPHLGAVPSWRPSLPQLPCEVSFTPVSAVRGRSDSVTCTRTDSSLSNEGLFM
jgi:hypothetical protein